jgi:hypothetical protein
LFFSLVLLVAIVPGFNRKGEDPSKGKEKGESSEKNKGFSDHKNGGV